MPQTTTVSTLDKLKKISTVVADTSEFELISQYKPQDATTNPSLILKAFQKKEYRSLIEEAIHFAKAQNSSNLLECIIEKLFVNFGIEILKIIPGRVSIEVDSKYSFDKEKSFLIAKKIISLFKKANIDKERILIKLATTWEGLQAAALLEKENIHCNMTLLFSLPQAIAAANNKVTLVSPFVGRILDWYKKNENKQSYLPEKDPGVLSVKTIYNYYKKFELPTEIMGASFRNIEEIIELAGCDLLTISPALLEELQNSDKELICKLNAQKAKESNLDKIDLDEKTFRYLLNQNAMATEKLAEGIRLFEKDLNSIKDLLKPLL